MSVDAVDLAGVVELLRACASELDPVLERRAVDLARRLGEGEFRIAVCGGFSNGKSSLINALVGADLLPVGVLPVTAIATEVRYGPAATAEIQLANGCRQPIEVSELTAWVSEAANPGNTKGVDRVIVETPSALLEPGVTLVDTPGLESIFEHNDSTAIATIRHAEGALVVLSADAPLTAAERRLLDVVAERSSATFFALNRADHLNDTEIDEAAKFVADAVRSATGSDHPVVATSARRARPDGCGDTTTSLDRGTDALAEALQDFVDEQLVAARDAAFSLAVRRLADELADADALATATSRLSTEQLADRIGRFERAAEVERTRLAEDTIVLAAAVQAINGGLADWIAREGRAPIPDISARFAEISQQTPLHRLEPALEAEVQRLVEERFDDLRPRAATRAEHSWGDAATEFAERVQTRADAIRAIAQETFGAPLPPVPAPHVADEPDRFWYQFYRPELPDASLWRVLRLLLPHPLVRRRLIGAAHRRLDQTLDQHAGRARSALADRLAATHRRFTTELEAFVESLIDDIERAAQRTRSDAATIEARVDADERRHQRLAAAIAAANAATSHAKTPEAPTR